MTNEWDEASETVVDPEGAITEPHAVLELPGYEVGRADGCKACWSEGQEDAIAAFYYVCRARGLSDGEIDAIVVAMRQRFTPL